MKLRVFHSFLFSIIALIGIGACPQLFGSSIGSDTSVTRIDSTVALTNGQRVAGFVALDGGFSLFSSLVTATWDCFFPASTTVDFEGGTLVLTTDLNFTDTTTFYAAGNIVGNNHHMDFSSTMTCIVNTPLTRNCSNAAFMLGAKTFVQNDVSSFDWTFNSETVLVGCSDWWDDDPTE